MAEDPPPPSPTADELREAGVVINAPPDSESRTDDLLERYRSVPNHALFLYTSEDRMVSQYIRDHWSALDGMSADACDIHVSLTQLQGRDDAYSQLDDLRSIIGLGAVSPKDLPALHIWSQDASVRVPLSPYRTHDDLRDALRRAFGELHDIGGPVDETTADRLVRAMESTLPAGHGSGQMVAHARIGGNVTQITHNHHYGTETPMPDHEGDGRSTQSATDMELTGKLVQKSDAPQADQVARRLRASEVEQDVANQTGQLTVGQWSAKGTIAIVALVVVVIAVVLARVLTA